MTTTFAALGLVAALAPVACSAKVLSFEPTASTLSAITDKSIASLTDEQADQVCAWLATSYPSPPFNLPIADSTTVPEAPGYLSGGGFAFVNSPTTAAIAWVALAPESACVANLRHSACEATVASLEQCVQYFQNQAPNPSGTYADAMTACAAFEGAANCDQTVFHAMPPGTQPEVLEFCGMLLPVTSDATCSLGLSGSTDGGTD